LIGFSPFVGVMNNCSDKGELLFSIPETATLADESEEIILGYIVTRKIDYRTVFSTRYVTEQGISEILSWHGAIYDPVVASELLNQKPSQYSGKSPAMDMSCENCRRTLIGGIDLRNKSGIIWCFLDNEWKPLSDSCNNFTPK